MGIVRSVDSFLGTHLWLSCAIVGTFALWVFLRRVLTRDLKHFGSRIRQLMNVIGGGLTIFAILAAHALITVFLRIEQGSDIATSLMFATYLAVYVVVSLTVARAVEMLWVNKSSFIDDGHIPGLPRVLLFGAALVIGVTAFGVAQGLSINGLYVSTGAMAALIAFAMQRTLGDLFSGISLSVERPFKIGDWIELEDGTNGEVRDLNWRATRLRDWDNTTLVVPNGKLAGQTIRNLHGPGHRYSPVYNVKLPAEVDPRFAKSLLLEVALKCKNVSKERLPSVRLVDAGTVPYSYMVWLHFPTYPAMFAGREEFFRNMHYALKEAGIQSVPSAQDIRFRSADEINAKPPSIMHALRSLDFAALFNEDEFETLNMRSYSAFVDAGSVILPEGEVAPSVYIILNGVVETSVTDSLGRTRALDPLKSGEYFGLASMLTDAPSFQTFTASSDVSLVQIDRKCFRDIASQREALLQGFAEIVETRMMLVDKVRNDPGNHSGSGRLYDILQRMEKIIGK